MFGRGRRGQAAQPVEEPEPDQQDGGQEPTSGPHDVADAPEDGAQRLDLGSVRVPVPEGSQLQVELDPSGPVRAVHLVTPVGRLTISAYAAPRTGQLWPEVSQELAQQLRNDGAAVHAEQGRWGEELVADSPDAMLRFVGVDGPRWLLRAVAASPAAQFADCGQLLYSMVENTVVVRGDEPLPVRTPLPIELPEEIAQHIQQQAEQHEEQG
jgi:hypothetical protein